MAELEIDSYKVLLDAEDISKIKEHTWCVNRNTLAKSAAIAYDKKAIELRGNKAQLNFTKETI